MKIWNAMIKSDSTFKPASHMRDRFFYGQAIAECVKAIIRRYRFSRKGDLASFFLGETLSAKVSRSRLALNFLPYARISLYMGIALLVLCGCAITPISFRRHEIYEFQTYKGKLTVHVAGQTRVNDEILKAGATDTVYGFYGRHCPDEREAEEKAVSEGRLHFSQPCEYEIWTTAYIDTIMHELKHFFEGKFHD